MKVDHKNGQAIFSLYAIERDHVDDTVNIFTTLSVAAATDDLKEAAGEVVKAVSHARGLMAMQGEETPDDAEPTVTEALTEQSPAAK